MPDCPVIFIICHRIVVLSAWSFRTWPLAAFCVITAKCCAMSGSNTHCCTVFFVLPLWHEVIFIRSAYDGLAATFPLITDSDCLAGKSALTGAVNSNDKNDCHSVAALASSHLERLLHLPVPVRQHSFICSCCWLFATGKGGWWMAWK